jgi:hypothetical protein
VDMKQVKRFFKNILSVKPNRIFYIAVKCSDCKEEVVVRIDQSSDFQVEYNAHNPKHRYTIKKEAIGKNCFNLMSLTLALTREIKVLFVDTKGCEFIKFYRE